MDDAIGEELSRVYLARVAGVEVGDVEEALYGIVDGLHVLGT